ncbi:MAG TPA: CdaR family protein [Symbiobacteriaceae bacterium]|jgi:YbbR domain-containing protein|nr:CdaR family protein [Symbiobacteriaceae bacterium]
MMERLFQHPGWLKLFSVALAILLWAMVMPRYASETSTEFEVPLEVTYHPDFQLDEGPQDRQRTVTVEVKGKNLLVSKVKANMLYARVDYSKITEPGKQQQVEVQVGGKLEGLKYTPTPRTIPVTLVVRSELAVPVQVEAPTPNLVVQGDREWTFVAHSETDTVTLSGRIDYLNTVRVARVVLDKADLQPGVTSVTKTVIPTDNANNKVDKLNPAKVNVVLTWTELPPGKAFKVQPVTKGTLPEGLVVTSTEVLPVTVPVRALTLNGKLPDKEVVETEAIDLTGKRASFTATVNLVPPAGTSIALQTVNVKVNIAETPGEKVFKGVPLTVRGAAANAVITPAVTDVQLHVKGPYNVVNALEGGEFTAYVDVEGLAVGRHMLPVKVSGPTGVTSADSDPVTVEVTISAAP